MKPKYLAIRGSFVRVFVIFLLLLLVTARLLDIPSLFLQKMELPLAEMISCGTKKLKRNKKRFSSTARESARRNEETCIQVCGD